MMLPDKKIYLTGIFLTLLVTVFAFLVLDVVHKRTDAAVAKNLTSVLLLTHASIDEWLELNKEVTAQYADSSFIRSATKALILAKMRKLPLPQKEIRGWYRGVAKKHNYLGYFIIDRQGVNLSSSRDTNLNTPSLLKNQHGLLEAVFAGGSMNSMPLKTDVPIQLNGEMRSDVYSIFSVAPVVDEKGVVIGAFAFRINPDAKLSYFLGLASVENTIKIIPINRHFEHIHLSAKISRDEIFESLSKAEVSSVLQSNKIAPEQVVSLQEYFKGRVLGAMIWDIHLGVGLFGYVVSTVAHQAYKNAGEAIVLLSAVVIALIWLVLWEFGRSQSQLIKSKDWFENLLNSIPSIICVIRKNGILKYGNKNLHKLNGLVNKIARNSVPHTPPFFSSAWCMHGSMLNSVWGPWCESHVDQNGNEKLFIFECLEVADESGKPIDLVVANDITLSVEVEKEKQKLLNQLQQLQKMEAVGQLTGGVAHDFNNMLSVILGYTQLSMEYLTQDNDKLREYLREINIAGMRGQEMIRQMLAYSRQNKCSSHSLNPKPILDETVRMLKATIPSSITLLLKPAVHDVEVFVDPVQLQQVIVNLIINARDAMNDKGVIVCSLEEAEEVQLICDSCHNNFSGQYVIISVQDSGSGIGNEAKSRIFDPFFTSKAVGKGSGMGLAMVHGIMHSVGGHIIVNSKQGLGTEIVLFLPDAKRTVNHVGKRTA